MILSMWHCKRIVAVSVAVFVPTQSTHCTWCSPLSRAARTRVVSCLGPCGSQGASILGPAPLSPASRAPRQVLLPLGRVIAPGHQRSTPTTRGTLSLGDTDSWLTAGSVAEISDPFFLCAGEVALPRRAIESTCPLDNSTSLLDSSAWSAGIVLVLCESPQQVRIGHLVTRVGPTSD